MNRFNILLSMRRGRRIFLFIAVFVFTAGVLVALLRHSGLFVITSVPIEFLFQNGDKTTVPSTVSERMKSELTNRLQGLKGKALWKIELGELRASLARNEWVKDLLISRRFPNELRVQVRPKAVALVLVDKQDKFYPVTEEGELLSSLPAGELPDVPLLRGEIFKNDDERRKKAVKFALSLNEEGYLSLRNVSEITWSQELGYTLVLLQPKVEVVIGEENVDLKVARVTQVLNYLSANNLKGRVIDASFSKKVLVRLRKEP